MSTSSTNYIILTPGSLSDRFQLIPPCILLWQTATYVLLVSCTRMTFGQSRRFLGALLFFYGLCFAWEQRPRSLDLHDLEQDLVEGLRL